MICFEQTLGLMWVSCACVGDGPCVLGRLCVHPGNSRNGDWGGSVRVRVAVLWCAVAKTDGGGGL
jgi:hypothetical protein